MKIYELRVDYDNNFASCIEDHDACRRIPGKEELIDYDLDIWFDGTPQFQSWWARKMILCENDDGSVDPVGDFALKLGVAVMLLENQAINKLKNFLENVEILPVDCNFGDYSAINILTVLDCLDYEHSEFGTIDIPKPDGRPYIVYITKYAFRKEVIEGHKLFKIYDNPRASMYASQEFVDEVNRLNLTGVSFDLIWEG